MTSKQVRDCEDSKVEPRSRSRCPEVHGASMSQRDPTALSSAFVKGPFETWLLLLLVSGLGFQPSAPKQLRDANLGPDAGGPINPVLACGVEMLSSRFGGTQLRGSRRGRRPVCPAERSSASGNYRPYLLSVFRPTRRRVFQRSAEPGPFKNSQSTQAWERKGTWINYPLPFELVTENLQPRDNSLTSANPLSMYPFFDKAEA
jgi:hypothetical protein